MDVWRAGVTYLSCFAAVLVAAHKQSRAQVPLARLELRLRGADVPGLSHLVEKAPCRLLLLSSI